jgi:hypothetical protein
MERIDNAMEVWCSGYYTESESHFSFKNMAAYYTNLKSHQNLKISAWSVVLGQRC